MDVPNVVQMPLLKVDEPVRLQATILILGEVPAYINVWMLHKWTEKHF